MLLNNLQLSRLFFIVSIDKKLKICDYYDCVIKRLIIYFCTLIRVITRQKAIGLLFVEKRIVGSK